MYSECIVPNLRAATEVYLGYKHLLVTDGIYEFPLVAMSAACGVNIKEYSGALVPNIFSKFATFTQSWAPLLRRWCDLALWPASGASHCETHYVWIGVLRRQSGDTSIMQPTDPSPQILQYCVMVAMLLITGKKEQVKQTGNAIVMSLPHHSRTLSCHTTGAARGEQYG